MTWCLHLVFGITINVPVVFMARYVMTLRGATSLRGALEGVGPENQDFFGPEMPRAKRVPFGPKKVITYPAIKTTGTLIVLCTRVLLCSVVVCCCVLWCVVVCCCVLLCVRGLTGLKSPHWLAP